MGRTVKSERLKNEKYRDIERSHCQVIETQARRFDKPFGPHVYHVRGPLDHMNGRSEQEVEDDFKYNKIKNHWLIKTIIDSQGEDVFLPFKKKKKNKKTKKKDVIFVRISILNILKGDSCRASRDFRCTLVDWISTLMSVWLSCCKARTTSFILSYMTVCGHYLLIWS